MPLNIKVCSQVFFIYEQVFKSIIRTGLTQSTFCSWICWGSETHRYIAPLNIFRSRHSIHGRNVLTDAIREKFGSAFVCCEGKTLTDRLNSCQDLFYAGPVSPIKITFSPVDFVRTQIRQPGYSRTVAAETQKCFRDQIPTSWELDIAVRIKRQSFCGINRASQIRSTRRW